MSMRADTGMGNQLVQEIHKRLNKCDEASSHNPSTNEFLTTYILLFAGLRASIGRIGYARMHCLNPNCLTTLSGMYPSHGNPNISNLLKLVMHPPNLIS
ncbi:hypothetical protein M9H77_31507 [Catharanthus roseus]|uniref:Uncharacterized protein n=1 Tax=Catharanthus roseus TaxID=4058 RepID=A0ACC0A260_CATRO|nr:hypothetical protein M9H77_31507 [Catharanthus roseus]